MTPLDAAILLDLPASLTTARMLLRVPSAGDGPALHEAVSESLPELRQFLASLPWVAAEPSVAVSEVYARQSHANFVARRDMPFLMFERATGRLLGATGLHRPGWATPHLEVGYWCRTSACGQGWVTEAVQAITAYAFDHARAVRVDLVTDAANHRSRAVAERCGFQLEGTLRQERRAPDGTVRDTCIYARIR